MQLDSYKLQVWVFGPLLKKIILTRFANYFSLLYASGVTILDSITIVEGIVGNRVIAQALFDMRKHISEGKSISESIDNVSLFPPLVLRMIRVGESTGALDSALDNVSYFYNREVKEAIERVQVLIEPALTIVLGLLLGWVVLAVLPPIYDVVVKLGK
jgi:type IV pilus assembly protein PilC